MAIRLGLFEHDPTSRFTAWIQAEDAQLLIRTGWCVAGERRDKEIPYRLTAAPCPFH